MICMCLVYVSCSYNCFVFVCVFHCESTELWFVKRLILQCCTVDVQRSMCVIIILQALNEMKTGKVPGPLEVSLQLIAANWNSSDE